MEPTISQKSPKFYLLTLFHLLNKVFCQFVVLPIHQSFPPLKLSTIQYSWCHSNSNMINHTLHIQYSHRRQKGWGYSPTWFQSASYNFNSFAKECFPPNPPDLVTFPYQWIQYSRMLIHKYWKAILWLYQMVNGNNISHAQVSSTPHGTFVFYKLGHIMAQVNHIKVQRTAVLVGWSIWLHQLTCSYWCRLYGTTPLAHR